MSAATGVVVYGCKDPTCLLHRGFGFGGSSARFGLVPGMESASPVWHHPGVLRSDAEDPVVSASLCARGGWWQGLSKSDPTRSGGRPPYSNESPPALTSRVALTPDYNAVVDLDGVVHEELRPTPNGYTLFGIRPVFPQDIVLGVEIEVENLLALQQPSAPARVIPKQPRNWYHDMDGSLRTGGEYTTEPTVVTVEFARQVWEFFKALRACGYAATPRCGGHLHFSPASESWNARTIKRMGLGWNHIAPVVSALSRPNRVNSSHARSISYAPGPHTYSSIQSPEHDGYAFGGPVSYYHERTLALNIFPALAKHNTVEIRAPQGTLDARRFLANVLWGSWLAHWAIGKGELHSLPKLDSSTMTGPWLTSLASALGAPPRTAVLMARCVEYYAKSLHVYNAHSVTPPGLVEKMASLEKLVDQVGVIAVPNSQAARAVMTNQWKLIPVPVLLTEIGRASHDSSTSDPMICRVADVVLNMLHNLQRTRKVPPQQLKDPHTLLEQYAVWGCNRSTSGPLAEIVIQLLRRLCTVWDGNALLTERPDDVLRECQATLTRNISRTYLATATDDVRTLPAAIVQHVSAERVGIADCFFHHKPLYDPQGIIPWAGSHTAMAAVPGEV